MTERFIDDRWYESDVQSVRPDLTSDQAWAVLRGVKDTHDAEIGINWDVIRFVADTLYPEPEDAGDDDE
jgi:hypothetical protein